MDIKRRYSKADIYNNTGSVGKCDLCSLSGYIAFRDIKNKDFYFVLCYRCYDEYIKFSGDLLKFISTRKGVLLI